MFSTIIEHDTAGKAYLVSMPNQHNAVRGCGGDSESY